MHYLVLLLATAALLSQSQSTCSASSIKRHYKTIPFDLLTEENVVGGKALRIKHSFTKFARIKVKPLPTVTHVEGTALELTCEGVGSPAPSIQWFRNNEPLFGHDLDSNEIIDPPYSSIAQIIGKLIIATPSPNPNDVYTCLVTAGRHTESTTTTVENIQSNTIETERHNHVPLAPEIVVYYEVYADIIGSDAIFPCRAKGHPRPLIEWYDTTGEKVGKDPRMEILQSGELSITNLTWRDMGEFTCEASNAFGKTSQTTFVYPVTDED